MTKSRLAIRLMDGSTEYIEAFTWEYISGVLVLYDEKNEVIRAYACGVWKSLDRLGDA